MKGGGKDQHCMLRKNWLKGKKEMLTCPTKKLTDKIKKKKLTDNS